METVELNIELESIEAVNKWEEENIPNRMYNGKCVMMVNLAGVVGEDKVLLKSLTLI